MNQQKITTNNFDIQKTILASLFLISISGIIFSATAYADVVPPKKQMDFGSSPDKIFCKEELFKVIRTSDGQASCVKPSTASKLVKSGWAKNVDDSLLEKMMTGEKQPVGFIKFMSVTKETGKSVRLDSNMPTASYNYVFQVCAYDKIIRAPEVLISSDSEVKNIKLANKIFANSCTTTSANIKAAESNSIKTILLNKGGVTEKINSLESKVNDLKQQLDSEKLKLEQVVKSQAPSSVDQSAQKITELRKELNSAREELNRYMFALHMTPKKSEARPVTTYTGDIKDATVTALTITEQVSSQEVPHSYNVVFRACSDQMIRMPQVTITSDTESKTIRMADKISPKTCQTSTGIIKADKKSSITLALVNNDDLTKAISELENNISDLQSKMVVEQSKLNELVMLQEKPNNYDQRISELNIEITKIRNQINESRNNLHQIMNQVYR